MDNIDDSSSQIESTPIHQPDSKGAPIKPSKPNDNISLADNSLLVDISDALSEKDKVKFTVHTRTSLPEFQKTDFFVVRQHEEFIWLHDRFEENEDYAGYIIPPAPPKPDFDASREKLQRLGEGEGALTREEFVKMKEELEDEYLATFKKTVAMHEVFLTRLAAHPIFRNDSHLRVFLEYDQDLCAKPKGKFDILGGLVKSFGNTTDEFYLSATLRDVNDFFEQEMSFLSEYNNHLKEATQRADKMTSKHKEVADSYIKVSSSILHLATLEQPPMERFLTKVSETFEKCRKIEGRVASDQDLKLADTFRYYQRDSHAAKALLVRRLRCLQTYEAANRSLDKARSKNKDVHAPLEVQEAEQAQTDACAKFESMSARGREELVDFCARRVQAFRKSLIEMAELEIKHAKAQQENFRKSIIALQNCQ